MIDVNYIQGKQSQLTTTNRHRSRPERCLLLLRLPRLKIVHVRQIHQRRLLGLRRRRLLLLLALVVLQVAVLHGWRRCGSIHHARIRAVTPARLLEENLLPEVGDALPGRAA